MSIPGYYNLCRVLRYLREWGSLSGINNLKQVSVFYGKSRAQTYRDLRKAVSVGLVRVETRLRGSVEWQHYVLTEDGCKFLEELDNGGMFK